MKRQFALDIYFSDLTSDAQKELMDFFNMDRTEAEQTFELTPITSVFYEDEG